MPSSWIENGSKVDRCAICIFCDRVGLIPVCWSLPEERLWMAGIKPTVLRILRRAAAPPPTDSGRTGQSGRTTAKGRVDIGPSAVVQT